MKCCILRLYILGRLPVLIYIGLHLLHIPAISGPTTWAELFGNSTLDAYLRGYTRLLPAPGNEVPMKSNTVIT